MERYRGLFFGLKHIFSHYISLSTPVVFTILLVGFFATIAGLVTLFGRLSRKRIVILRILVFLPIIMGLAGTIMTISNTEAIISMEEKSGLGSSAMRYFDFEYLYTKILLYVFPLFVGILASLPPLIILGVILRKDARGQHK